MTLNDPQGSREEIKLFSQPVLQVPFVREMKTRLAARRKKNKRWWTQPNLRHVLHMQS
jgi:hypothetical protein